MKANLKSIVLLVVLVAVIVTAVSYFSDNGKGEESFSYADLVEMFELDLVKSFEVDGNLLMTLVAYVPELDEDKEIGRAHV